MFALPGVVGLVVFLYARPTDIFESLSGTPILTILLVVALIGIALDIRLGVLSFVRIPFDGIILAFAAWAAIASLANGPRVFLAAAPQLLNCVIVYFVIAHGVSTIGGVKKVMTALLLCIGVITGVVFHQALQPKQCVVLDPREPDNGPMIPEGRECQSREQCRDEAVDTSALYGCEKMSVYNIGSVANGRVRYTGMLKDPNEVALCISLALPILYVWAMRRRSYARIAVAIVATLVITFAVIMTQSRGGLLVIGMVALVIAVRRFGWSGVVAAGMAVAPVLLLAPKRVDAEGSSAERMEAQFAGLTEMLWPSPVRGVGMKQYAYYAPHTAHNAYVLTAGELGFLGGVLFTGIMYYCLKSSLLAYLRYRKVERAELAAEMHFVLLASMAGMAVGIFFLSFAYHFVLWTYFGVIGALYGATQRHDRRFSVTISKLEMVGLFVGEAVGLVLLFLYIRKRF